MDVLDDYVLVSDLTKIPWLVCDQKYVHKSDERWSALAVTASGARI